MLFCILITIILCAILIITGYYRNIDYLSIIFHSVYDYKLFIYCIVGKVELDLTKIKINLFKITWSVSL